MARLELPVEGMTCNNCVRHVTEALEGVPGVRHAEVSLHDGKATVDADDAVSSGELAAAVERAGYHAGAAVPVSAATAAASSQHAATHHPALHSIGPVSATPPVAAPAHHAHGGGSLLLDIEGMTCASCVSRVETALAHVPGVKSARANLATNQAAVELVDGGADPGALVSAVKRAGYTAHLPSHDEHAAHHSATYSERELANWRRRLFWAIAMLVPVVLPHLLALLHVHVSGVPGLAWVQLAAATVLQFYVGWPFYVGAYRRAIHFSTNMDTLVAIGTLAAYGTGVWGMFASAEAAHASLVDHSMSLMDAGTILTFITLGKYLEARAKGRASSAIRKLLDLAPPLANVERQGRIVSVPPPEVAIGETIVVRPGEKVPLDALVLWGTSSMDESWLTGESIPVEKSAGAKILAGTINGQGALNARVEKTADQTALAQVVELVRKAQESKTEVQRLADQVVSWFVPIVLAIALVTLLVWGFVAGAWLTGVAAMIAVLVVACPCALGLATPTAILVASGRGAERGILIKEAHALELAGRLKVVVLDKTGTITEGKPQVTAIRPASGVREDELLATAAAVERLSQHPLAAEIVAAAHERGLTLPTADGMEIVPGAGIAARGTDGELLVGNDRLMADRHVDWQSQQAEAEAFRTDGQAPLLVARSGRYLGMIVVADPIAAHSREAVAKLKSQGLRVVLLSGDHRAIAQRVAREVGIDEVHAEVLPADKQAVIDELRAAGQVVAMVGDGINDAPALAAADLGVAVGSGSDIAVEAADIVIVGGDLRGVPRTVALARATLRTIKQNLGWAFVYNLILIPLAAGVFVPIFGIRLPGIAAAAAMALSSVSVVGNSLLLRARSLD